MYRRLDRAQKVEAQLFNVTVVSIRMFVGDTARESKSFGTYQRPVGTLLDGNRVKTFRYSRHILGKVAHAL